MKTLMIPRSRIVPVVNMRRAMNIIEDVFHAHGLGRVQMPAKIYIHLDKYHGDFRAMPAYIAGMEACGIKWVNVHPGNRSRGLPSVMAVIIVSSPKTGLPLAIMDGTYITSLRTGAAGGIAAKYLARRRSSSAGFVGCGVQAANQFLALIEIFRLKTVDVYDTDRARAALFVKRTKLAGLKFRICDNIEECVRGKDIVVTSTPSRRPIIDARWISPGTHINAIGADAKGKEELDPAIFKKAGIFVDDVIQASHSGEINVPIAEKMIKISDIRSTLGEVIAKKKKGRRSQEDITIFDSTGLAVQDVAVADYVYRSVLRRRGRRVSGIDLAG
ncbi:MAG: alanine dehydrogenase [Candidatus Omnitrophica bacterium]|nr:alanine dehydrogenase [Candidatus Omnitrophota bacterium]